MISSRDSSSSRDTVVHLTQKQERTFPITPIKNEEYASLTTEGNSATLQSTLQERRGRRNITNNGFRPLSVFTQSMLIPFDQNFDAAFEALQSDSPDRVEIAKSILSTESPNGSVGTSRELGCDKIDLHQESLQKKPPDLLRAADSPDDQSQSQRGEKETITPERSTMSQRNVIQDCGMDLMTALLETSPEKDSTARVSGDFTTLCELPVPDPSEHPAFAPNAFEVKTETPLLFASTGADAIRALYVRRQRRSEDPPSVGRQSIERKKSLFGLGISTPSSAKSRNTLRSSDGSTLPLLIPTPDSQGVRSSINNASPTAADTQPRESTSIERNNGVRKFSDLFKRKDSMEKNSPVSPAWSSRSSVDTPNLDREDLERYLRRITATPTLDFDPYSDYPRHPNTGRGWKSRNLKCTTCSPVDCAVCHRVCCAYRAAFLALDNHKEGSPGRPIALQRIQEITKLFPYGKEAPTFLQCTAGGISDDTGCGKIVCPDCCSVCPDESCADTVCRRCKPLMWRDCNWHKHGILSNRS